MTRPMNVPPMLVGLAHVFVRFLRAEVGDSIVRRVVEIAENMGGSGRQIPPPLRLLVEPGERRVGSCRREQTSRDHRKDAVYVAGLPQGRTGGVGS